MTSDLVEQLIYASANGELNEVQSLILQGCSVDSVDEDENTLLQIASANGHENIVRFLITKGASLDKGNMYGWTSLLQVSVAMRMTIRLKSLLLLINASV